MRTVVVSQILLPHKGSLSWILHALFVKFAQPKNHLLQIYVPPPNPFEMGDSVVAASVIM